MKMKKSELIKLIEDAYNKSIREYKAMEGSDTTEAKQLAIQYEAEANTLNIILYAMDGAPALLKIMAGK